MSHLFTNFTHTSNTKEDATPTTVTLTISSKKIHSLEELRENFQLNEIITAFQNKTLEQWLQYMFYEQEAEEVKLLSSDDKNADRKLCQIFKVAYEDVVNMSAEERELWEERKKQIQQYTHDSNILSNSSIVALNQKELANLLRSKTPVIYLCHGKFSLPLSATNTHYIGIGNPTITNPFTKEQYKKAGITVDNIELPNTENPDTKEYALRIAKENGYDDFSENHTTLCSVFHNTLKTFPFTTYLRLPKPDLTSCMDFKRKSDCTSARNSCIEKAYRQAQNYLTPKKNSCIATELAKHYSSIITDCFTPVMETLKLYCQSQNLDTLYTQLEQFVNSSQQQLLQLFETELLDNKDYYKMYDINYFINQTEIEEHDYRINGDDEPIFKLIETVFANNIEYSFLPFDAIMEMEQDLNNYFTTFSTAAYSQYKSYVTQIEELLQEIPVTDIPRNEEENLKEYIQKLCSQNV